MIQRQPNPSTPACIGRRCAPPLMQSVGRRPDMLRYIELKTGYHGDGPAWIGRVKVSKSGRTIYFEGRALKKGARGAAGSFYDLETGEAFWVSGIKRDGQDRHWAGSGKVLIEAAAVDEYLSLIGEPALDKSRFIVTNEIRESDPADFVGIENKPL